MLQIISLFLLEKVLLFVPWLLTALQDSKFLWFHDNFQWAWLRPAKKQICKFSTRIFRGERWESSCFRWVISKEAVRWMHSLKRIEYPDCSSAQSSVACKLKLSAGTVMIIFPALNALKRKLWSVGSGTSTSILAINKAAQNLHCNSAYQASRVRAIFC